MTEPEDQSNGIAQMRIRVGMSAPGHGFMIDSTGTVSGVDPLLQALGVYLQLYTGTWLTASFTDLGGAAIRGLQGHTLRVTPGDLSLMTFENNGPLWGWFTYTGPESSRASVNTLLIGLYQDDTGRAVFGPYVVPVLGMGPPGPPEEM